MNSMPQYEVGHLDRVAEIETQSRNCPFGTGWKLVSRAGIPDCIRSGEAAAQSLMSI